MKKTRSCRGERSPIMLIALGMAASALAGCCTDCHILELKVEEFGKENVTLLMDVDLNPEAKKWSEHRTSFRYLVFSDETQSDPAFQPASEPPAPDSSGLEFEELKYDASHLGHWEGSTPEWEQQVRRDSGDLEFLGEVAPGRWRCRVYLPYRECFDIAPDDPSTFDYDRPGAYEFKSGKRYLIRGAFCGIKYMLEPWYASGIVELRIRIPTR